MGSEAIFLQNSAVQSKMTLAHTSYTQTRELHRNTRIMRYLGEAKDTCGEARHGQRLHSQLMGLVKAVPDGLVQHLLLIVVATMPHGTHRMDDILWNGPKVSRRGDGDAADGDGTILADPFCTLILYYSSKRMITRMRGESYMKLLTSSLGNRVRDTAHVEKMLVCGVDDHVSVFLGNVAEADLDALPLSH